MLKATKVYLIALFLFLTSCSTSQPEPPATLLPPTGTSAPSTATFTPTPEPTATSTPRPTATLVTEFNPGYFSFPVTFEGEYALRQKLYYAPCFHWDGDYVVTGENWYDDFHAGDMYTLRYGSTPQTIIVISPVSGTIENVFNHGDNGLLLEISTNYYIEGKRVFVDVSHVNMLFPGDDTYPQVFSGDIVVQGQPIGISDSLFDWGVKQQALDIAIRNGPAGANPEYPNFSPTSYLDPFLYLKDDIKLLKEHIKYDYQRDHCLLSNHFPQP